MSADQTLIDDSFEPYRDYLLLVARGMIGVSYRGKVEAEELVNESLFDAFQQRERFKGTTEAECIAWLRRILTDNVTDALRFLHRDKRDINKEQRLVIPEWDQSCSRLFEITSGFTSPSVKAVKNEQELLLAGALAELPENQRIAVECHHLHGCSLAETAEALGCTVPAVAGLLRRGLRQLRETLQPKSEFP
jgi:RNA polymerase sigma-70 factor, ECF subfamily